MKRFILLIILHLFTNFTFCQNEYQLTREDQDIKVYFRQPGKHHYHIKIEAIIETDTKTLLQTIDAVENYPDWVYRCTYGKLLKKGNKTLYYTITDVPWPFKDRDVVSLVMPAKHIKTNSILLKTTSTPSALPEKPELTRMRDTEVEWLIKQLKTNQIKVEYKLSLYVEEDLPDFIMKMISTKGPFESFKKLKEMLES
jgi:ribosome-associated toxin RatA of RatAB toxin-antitoxin module